MQKAESEYPTDMSSPTGQGRSQLASAPPHPFPAWDPRPRERPQHPQEPARALSLLFSPTADSSTGRVHFAFYMLLECTCLVPLHHLLLRPPSFVAQMAPTASEWVSLPPAWSPFSLPHGKLGFKRKITSPLLFCFCFCFSFSDIIYWISITSPPDEENSKVTSLEGSLSTVVG